MQFKGRSADGGRRAADGQAMTDGGMDPGGGEAGVAPAPAAAAAVEPYPAGAALWGACLVTRVVDQISKILVEAAGRSLFVTVIPGFFNVKYVENHGGAWGFLAGADESFRMPFFIVSSVVAIAFLAWMRARVRLRRRWTGWGFPAILAGAVGNLIDRVRLGYVIDFLDFHVGKTHWPTFNVADIGITVGVGLLILDSFMPARLPQPPATDP